MNLKKLLLTENDCYKSGKKHTVKGIMVHSTGANNPNLKRYVGPDDGLLGKNQYNNHWNNPSSVLGRQACVHAFIGKLADGSVATYQTLPWDIVGWHSGSGRLGSAKNANNNGYIGFEICEDGLTDAAYFNAAYKEAVELCALLCKQYNLDPTADGVIIGHFEGHKRGIASNHGDPNNWFPKHGKSMDSFRAAVKALVSTPDPAPTPKPTGEIKVGDIVEFTGNTHYTSASAKTGVSCKPGKAKVTALYPKGAHPYHLIRESGGGSTVYGWVNAADIKGATVTPPVVPVKPTPTPTPSPASGEFKVGDIVEFTGNTHYTSASAKTGVSCKPGKAKVTALYPKGAHPYHLIRESGGGSTVYGWVNVADIKGATVTPPVVPVNPAPTPTPAPVATIKVGSRVKVKNGAKTYTGGGLASFVYKTVYDVQQIKGDRVVIGLKGQVTAAVKLADLILQ